VPAGQCGERLIAWRVHDDVIPRRDAGQEQECDRIVGPGHDQDVVNQRGPGAQVVAHDSGPLD